MAYPRLLRAAACMGSCKLVLHLESVWTSRLSIFSVINLLPSPPGHSWYFVDAWMGGVWLDWCCITETTRSMIYLMNAVRSVTSNRVNGCIPEILRYSALFLDLASLGIILSLCGVKLVWGTAWATYRANDSLLWPEENYWLERWFRAIWIIFSSELLIVWCACFPVKLISTVVITRLINL